MGFLHLAILDLNLKSLLQTLIQISHSYMDQMYHYYLLFAFNCPLKLISFMIIRSGGFLSSAL